MVNAFAWPPPSPTMRSLSNILDLPSLGVPGPNPMSATNMKNLNTIMAKMTEQKREQDLVELEYMHDLVSSRPHSSLGKRMTLTKTRCSVAQGYYCSKRSRPLYVADFLRLKGICAKRFGHLPAAHGQQVRQRRGVERSHPHHQGLPLLHRHGRYLEPVLDQAGLDLGRRRCFRSMTVRA